MHFTVSMSTRKTEKTIKKLLEPYLTLLYKKCVDFYVLFPPYISALNKSFTRVFPSCTRFLAESTEAMRIKCLAQ